VSPGGVAVFARVDQVSAGPVQARDGPGGLGRIGDRDASSASKVVAVNTGRLDDLVFGKIIICPVDQSLLIRVQVAAAHK